jgi:NAD(P) transhydrogenase
MSAESQTATTPIEKIEHILAQKLEQGDLELPLLPQVASQVMDLTSDPAADAASTIPVGIYTIPEMASIGLDEHSAHERYREPLIGRARFEEVARAQISGAGQGLLKMVADPSGKRLLGVQIVGDSATELVHIGQSALQQGATIESFIDNVFNFPTYAEAYRVAALDIIDQAAKRRTTAEAA